MAFNIRSITSADSVFSLSIAGLYDVPQLLQGYTADAAFATDAVNPAENVLGVDGIMSSGWIPTLTPQTISIMPDSPSSDIFDNWKQAQDAGRYILFASAVIILPGVQRQFSLSRGVLTSYPAIPSAGKVLQGRQFGVTWNTVTSAPL